MQLNVVGFGKLMNRLCSITEFKSRYCDITLIVVECWKDEGDTVLDCILKPNINCVKFCLATTQF